ncbi:MAG: flagellar hook basal-body protein [Balneolaceae bacterium]
MIDRLTHSMQALQRLMRAQEVTANNMANLNTPGFKADKLFYHSYMEKINGEYVSKVVPRQTINMEQGHFESTGNPYDLAIEGDGFFEVELDGQQLLTRNGRFRLNEDGYLVNEQGAMVTGGSGPVHIPSTEQTTTAENEVRLEISKEGNILLNGILHDKIDLVTTERFEQLERHSSGYFTAPEGVVLIPDKKSAIMQGYYEAGNVSPLRELSEMMTNANAFEAQQKALTTTDELLSRATASLGKF